MKTPEECRCERETQKVNFMSDTTVTMECQECGRLTIINQEEIEKEEQNDFASCVVVCFALGFVVGVTVAVCVVRFL